MKTILAIDPGTYQSGWCVLDGNSVINSGVSGNDDILIMVRSTDVEMLVIERIASYGMPVGKDIFETCEFVGEFKK